VDDRDDERAVAAAAAGDAWLATHPPSVRWIEGQFAPAGTPTDAAVVQRIAAAHSLLTGSTLGMHGVPYGSDLRFYANDAQMPAVLFGPGDVRLAHTVDEEVDLRRHARDEMSRLAAETERDLDRQQVFISPCADACLT
jgi:acetylornithine deacetylase